MASPIVTSLPEAADKVAVRLDVPPASAIESADAVKVTPGIVSSSSIAIISTWSEASPA